MFLSLAFDYSLVSSYLFVAARKASYFLLFTRQFDRATHRSLHVKLDKAVVVRIIREQAVAPNEGSNREAVNPSSLSIIRDEG